MKWEGKPVINWFLRELFTTYGEETKEGPSSFAVNFDPPRMFEIEGKEYELTALSCTATRLHRNKRKWVSWTGDAFYDWHTGKFTVEAGGTLVGSGVETDIALWDDYEGEIPTGDKIQGLMFVVIHCKQKWDELQPVPDLMAL